MKDGVCPKCGSLKVIADLRLVEHHGVATEDTRVVLYGNPDAALFKEPQFAAVRAWLCGDCGFVEFYASNMKYLVKAHERLQRKRAAEQAPADVADDQT